MISLSNLEFQIISNEIRKMFGIHYHESRKSDLERIIKQIFRDYNFSSIENFKTKLLNGWLASQNVNEIAEYFTIGETYFFRETATFEALKYQIIPELTGKKKNLKIWSVSCSTGEEPYSIAIYLKEYFEDKFFLNAEIYGTDLSSVKIKKAKEAKYGNWSFRNCTSYIKDKYFIHSGKIFELKDEIKSKVSFRELNLNDDIYPAPFSNEEFFDIIIFRNTMIYFDQGTVDNIIEKLSSSLKTGGYLITGLSEISLVRNSSFKKVDISGGRYFVKEYQSSTIESDSDLKELTHEIDNIISLFERKKNFIKQKSDEDSLELIFNYSQLKEQFENGNYDYIIHTISNLLSQKSIDIFSSDKVRELFFIYCQSLANIGKIDDALELALNFVSVHKLDPEFYLLLYRLSIEKNDLENAAKYIQSAYFLNHDDIMINFSMALINSKLGKENLSRKNLKNTLTLLDNKNNDEIIEFSDGITAGNLKDIIESMLGSEYEKE